jgi:tRNA1Val (adenine37-N6)-methyltransferase
MILRFSDLGLTGNSEFGYMANDFFTFKQFTIYQDKCAFKVGTDGVLLGAYTDITGSKKILDIGTGSGLVALMLAQRSNAEIVAIEPDYDSFEQACRNFRESKWGKKIRSENIDLQSFKKNKIEFDLIVTNPPYFPDSLKNPDQRKASARHHITLSSDEILKCVSDLLTQNGRFNIILPYVEGNIFIAEAQAFGLYCNSILKIRPLPTSEIRRMILTFSKNHLKVSEKFLTIEHGKRHEYTEEYVSLTKDFYLKF